MRGACAAFAERTGLRLTMSPTGREGHAWKPLATRLEPLMDRGQVQFINHTSPIPTWSPSPAGRCARSWVLLEQARRYLQPDVIMLGRANHPTAIGLLDEIADLIRTRDLTPVTLDEMFGTARPRSPRTRSSRR